MTTPRPITLGVKGTDVIKTCKRCGTAVFIVTDEAHPSTRTVIRYQVDIEPVNGPHYTPPFFEHAGDGYWIERHRLLPGADAYHAVHHCEPPARCKFCEQVHTTTTAEAKTKVKGPTQ